MKHDNTHDPASSNGLQSEPFYFEFSHPTARAVRIAGTFNDWQPEVEPMYAMGDGYWLKKTVLPRGTYEYCLVVDGQWTPDPLARETVPNPFGGKNSLLKIAGWQKAAEHLETEQVQPKTANI
jgi:1,4-alpha-glucan branching enzyme